MPRRLRVYVAGPYSKGDPCENTRNAMAAGAAIMDLGHAPFVPHLSHFWHTMDPRPYEDWLALDLAWLPAADMLLRLPGESGGADKETAEAERLGIPVFFSLESLATALAAMEK